MGDEQWTRGFDVPCVLCGEHESVHVSLHNVGTFYCTFCEEEFDLDRVEDIVQGWGPVLDWLRLARPVQKEA